MRCHYLFLEKFTQNFHALINHRLVLQVPNGRDGITSDHWHEDSLLSLQIQAHNHSIKAQCNHDRRSNLYIHVLLRCCLHPNTLLLSWLTQKEDLYKILKTNSSETMFVSSSSGWTERNQPVGPCHRRRWTCLSCQDPVGCDQSNRPLGFCCPRICTGTEERSAGGDTDVLSFSHRQRKWNEQTPQADLTFSMIPAPRLWIAFSFLSGSGGLNWIKFFFSKVNGTVTRT